MLMQIYCTECGKGGGFPFTLEWDYEDTFCDKCHNRDVSTKKYYFCSPNCLKKFVKKFAGHNCDWEPRWSVAISPDTPKGEKDCIMSYNGDTDEVKIEEVCKICSQHRWRKIVGPERKLFKRQIDGMKDTLSFTVG